MCITAANYAQYTLLQILSAFDRDLLTTYPHPVRYFSTPLISAII